MTNSGDPCLNLNKCERQRKRLNKVYNRSPKRGAYGSCGQMVDSYEINLDTNAALFPCQAVRDLKNEMIRFSNSLFTNKEACERSKNRIAKVRWSASPASYFIFIKINWRMGVWKQNLDRKLRRNSIECSEEFSSTTQIPTTLVATTTKKVGAEFCDDKDDGVYSHDKSCSLYNQCYQGQTWEGRPCPAGLHFNPKVEICDWPANAGCTLE